MDEALDFQLGSTTLRVVKGDITEHETDAIVNAANATLMGGGGVDGAIHRRGGPAILEECKQIRRTGWPDGLPTGKAVITGGGTLKARYVIHTVGPIWRGGRAGEAELLANCYRNSLALARSKGLKSIAFPSISTGAYGYPTEEAHEVALRTAINFLEREDRLREVRFVLFNTRDHEIYERGMTCIIKD